MPELKQLLAELSREVTADPAQLSLAEDEKSLLVSADMLVPLMMALRGDHSFRMLAAMTAVDQKGWFELVYYVMDMEAEMLCVRVKLEGPEPAAPTLTGVWRAADVQEREIWDLFGIVFTGHPNLKRILNRDDFEGHPLRKDFVLSPVNRYQ